MVSAARPARPGSTAQRGPRYAAAGVPAGAGGLAKGRDASAVGAGPGRAGRSAGEFGQVRACEAGRAGGACGLLCGCVWLRLKAVTQTGANRIPLTVGSVCLASQRLGDISVRRQLSPPPTLGFAAAAAYAHYTETLVPALPGCAVYGNARTVHKPAGGAADA